MNIGKISVKNKYLIMSFVIAIIIFGIYSNMTIKTQLSPDTSTPKVTVITQYSGASAQDVSQNLIKPLEEDFGKLEGISKIKSDSLDNMGIVHLFFNYGTNVDNASIDVQNTINKIKDRLPKNIKDPKVIKFNTSDKPVMTLALTSKDMDIQDIRRMGEDKIAYELQLIDGVAAIEIFGGHIGEIKVTIDENKLRAYNLSLFQISKVLEQNNIMAPGGNIRDGNKEISLKIDEEFSDMEQLRSLRVPLMDGNYIKLGDIAEISYGMEELESIYRNNGKESIALMILKKQDANTVETIENINARLGSLEEKYPFIDFEIAQDDSRFTNQMVKNMTSSVFIAILCTAIIILLFLSNIGQSLVVAISMPLTFLSTLGLMKFFDMKLDLVTLSALILSIGFVVDDAIVIVENIMRHREEDMGKGILNAAIDGTNEIALSSLSGSTTTLVVLIPLLFIEGFVGEMFRPLSMTLIFALTSSVIISFVVIPIIAIAMDKFSFKRLQIIVNILSKPFNKIMDKILKFYLYILKKGLKTKLIYIVVIILLLVSGMVLKNKGIEMLPKFDSGTTYITVEMEPGTSIEETSKTMKYIESILDKEENIMGYDTQIGYERDSNIMNDFNTMGVNQGVITINLNTRKEREETIWDFQGRIRKEIEKIPGIKKFVVKEQGGTATTGTVAPIDIKISGEDQRILYNIALELENEIKSVKGIVNIYKSFHMDSPQLTIKTDPWRIQELGMNNSSVAKEIVTISEGVVSTDLKMEDRDEGIKIVYSKESRRNIEDIMDKTIDTPTGVKVPLRDLIWIEKKTRSNIVTKEDLKYTIDILGYTEGRAFSHITKDIDNVIKKFPVPKGYEISLSGEQEDLKDSMEDMIFLLALAVIFVYLVLLPQFKSLIYPLIIMVAIPLVIIGISPALILTNKYISMPVLLGFILLAGTVVNNSILLMDFFIKKIKSGATAEEAVIYGVKNRFRPIMMTVLSDVVGMIPLAFQLALGAERFSPLAIAVIGGILASTFITLLLIPTIFYCLEI